MLTPVWRTRLAALVGTAAALMIGFDIADGSLAWPVVVAAIMATVIVVAIQPFAVDTVLLGGALIGYIAGNRGFAQLSLSANLPLFPAESVLAIGGAFLLIRCTQQRALPIRRDALNIAILVWILVASVRVYSDLRQFGVMALRDYAMVYYAGFFFIAQSVAANERSRVFLERCVFAGCLGLAIIQPLFVRFPDFFLQTLTIRGVPAIYLKDDLAGTFLAVGSVWAYLRFETRRSGFALLLSLVLAGETITTNNRASMVGLLAATVLLLISRRWKLAAIQAAAGTAAAVVILTVAFAREVSWHTTPLYGVYERVVSIADPFGQRTYSATSASDKGDNNQFRMLWWRTVYDDTVAAAPLTGLGYGYDLAEHFVQEYYPTTDDDFMARSPHNFVLTVFARTGLIGVLPLLVAIGLLFTKTVQACRADLAAAAPWLAGCIIFVSACFGVVLEGPMGAVVFWTMLGVANASSAKPADAGAEVSDQKSEVSPAAV